MNKKYQALSKLDIATICYSFIKSKKADLAQKILNMLAPDQQRRLAIYINNKPMFTAKSIEDTLGKSSRLMKQLTKIYASTNNKKQSDAEVAISEFKKDCFFDFVGRFNDEEIANFFSKVPLNVAAIALKFMDKSLSVRCLSLIETKIANEVVPMMILINPPNKKLIEDFSLLIAAKQNELFKIQEEDSSEKEIISILELIRAYDIKLDESQLLRAIETSSAHMLTLDDILLFSDQELELILQDFNNPRDLAALMLLGSQEVRTKLTSLCTERLKALIAEEIEIINSDKDNLDKTKIVLVKIIQRIRELQTIGKIQTIKG